MHLRDKIIEARKFLFIAYFFDESDFKAMAVKFTRIIEEEDFQMMMVFRRNHRIGANIGDTIEDRNRLGIPISRHSLEPASYKAAFYRKHAAQSRFLAAQAGAE